MARRITIKKRSDGRFVIMTSKADKVLDDCKGYGYYNRYTAYAGFVRYTTRRWQKYRRELRKHEREETSSNTDTGRSL